MNNTIPVTIWVHGAYPPELLPLIGTQFNRGPLQRLFYCPPGLSRLKNLDRTLHHAEMLWMLSEKNAKQFPAEHIYLFGWSGKTDEHEQVDAAQALYKQIKDLYNEYELRYNDPVNLRIIAHTHGGTIALLIPAVMSQYHTITIHELMLLGFPVQRKSASYIGNTIFKKIYSAHSHFEKEQITAPETMPEMAALIEDLLETSPAEFTENAPALFKAALYSFERALFFARRHFHPHKQLIQVRVSNHGEGLIHLAFLLPQFIKSIPTCLHHIQTWHTQHPVQRYMTDDLHIDITSL